MNTHLRVINVIREMLEGLQWVIPGSSIESIRRDANFVLLEITYLTWGQRGQRK